MQTQRDHRVEAIFIRSDGKINLIQLKKEKKKIFIYLRINIKVTRKLEWHDGGKKKGRRGGVLLHNSLIINFVLNFILAKMCQL